MTKEQRAAAIEFLDNASLPLADAFQQACAAAGLSPGSLNSFEIAGLNSLGAATDYLRKQEEQTWPTNAD